LAPDNGEWESTVFYYLEGVNELEEMVDDPTRDLTTPFSWGEGQTLLHEVFLAAEHAAYHLGELIELQRWLAA
jgi:hypothetical protein